jgi:O-methyltransferase
VEAISRSLKPLSIVGEQDLERMVKLAAGAPAGGAFVEVGLYNGGSAWHLLQLANEQRRPCYFYDTFEGIPHWCEFDGELGHKLGEFKADSEREVREYLEGACVVRGVFPQSAVDMVPIAFAHLDCDQYQSVRESCQYLAPRMMDGGIILFDDSPHLQGARRAAEELYGDRLRFTHQSPPNVWGKHYVILKTNAEGITA